MNFFDQYEQMGLQKLEDGCFYYGDSLSQVVYRTNYTLRFRITDEVLDDRLKLDVLDKTGGQQIPFLSIFTGEVGQSTNYSFAGLVSTKYKFVGNEVVNERLRDSIKKVGTPIFNETTILSPNLTQMVNEMTVSSAKSFPAIGDIFPKIVIVNSYNGTLAVNVSFGLHIVQSSGHSFGLAFRNKISSFKQIHLQSSRTTVTTVLGDFLERFHENINELIDSNLNTKLDVKDILSTLDTVESLGKKRRQEVSSILSELSKKHNEISAWNIFVAILRYSSLEKNLNAKIMLENIAERTLNVPSKMTTLLLEDEES